MDYQTVIIKEVPENFQYSFRQPDNKGIPLLDTIHLSNFTVNHTELARKINKACSDYAKSGYRLVSSLPLQEGYDDHSKSKEYGYGFSCTTGVILTFEK